MKDATIVPCDGQYHLSIKRVNATVTMDSPKVLNNCFLVESKWYDQKIVCMRAHTPLQVKQTIHLATLLGEAALNHTNH